MIENLTLTNWKAFNRISVTFDRACTFVLSPNGVGKTSLLHGLMYAIFGDRCKSAVDPSNCLRFGLPAETEVRLRFENTAYAASTSALAVPPTCVTVRRRIAPVRSGVSVTTTVTMDNGDTESVIDGRRLSGDGLLDALMQTYWGMDGAVAADLMFLSDSAVWEHRERARRLNWIHQIEHALGITPLRTLAGEASTYGRAILREADGIRIAARNEAETVEQLRQRAAELREHAPIVKARIDELEDARRRCAAWVEYRAAVAKNAEVLQHIAERMQVVSRALSELVGDEDIVSEFSVRHETALRSVRRDVAELEQERTLALARLEMLAEHASLVQGGDDCPVCLRPLDDSSRASAVAAHEANKRGIEARIDVLDERLGAARGLEAKIRALAVPPDPEAAPLEEPPFEDVGEEDSAAELEELREERIASEVQLRQLEAEIADAASGDASKTKARELYRKYGLSSAVAQAAESAVRELVELQLDPIRREVQARWKRLWSDAEMPLELDEGGDVSIVVQGQRLQYESFSGGQKAIALIILRIVVMQTMTGCRMLLLDEPLEHLDPVHRKVVAQLLASAVASGAMTQVIATTYEENLVRGLVERARLVALRDGERAHSDVVQPIYVARRAAVGA